MKRNVDLTENRIFTIYTNIFDLLTFAELLEMKFPWEVGRRLEEVHSDDDLRLRQQRKNIIATGNKSERANIKFYREMDSPNYCDRCGKEMNLKPWNKEYGVCHECHESLERETIDKCLWRMIRVN